MAPDWSCVADRGQNPLTGAPRAYTTPNWCHSPPGVLTQRRFGAKGPAQEGDYGVREWGWGRRTLINLENGVSCTVKIAKMIYFSQRSTENLGFLRRAPQLDINGGSKTVHESLFLSFMHASAGVPVRPAPRQVGRSRRRQGPSDCASRWGLRLTRLPARRRRPPGSHAGCCSRRSPRRGRLHLRRMPPARSTRAAPPRRWPGSRSSQAPRRP